MERDLTTHEGKNRFQDELRKLPVAEFEQRFREASDEEYLYFLFVDFERRRDAY